MFFSNCIVLFFLLIGIVIFSFSLYQLFSRISGQGRFHNIVSALLSSPFIISLFLYTLFFIFPQKSGVFYIIVIYSIIWILFLTQLATIKKIFSNIHIPKNKISFNLSTKILLVPIFFTLLLISLRIIFWPVNWDDQIYYIQQSYALGQQRSLSDFFEWGYFDNGILEYQFNPAIRPAIPLIYASTSLFSDSLFLSVQFSKLMTLYFIFVFIATMVLSAIRIHTNKNLEGVFFPIFLVFSTYLFVNMTIMGFKELPIICFILLFFDFLRRPAFLKSNYVYIYGGILIGLMSYINLSGSLFACILFLIFFFLSQGKFWQKTGKFLLMLVFVVFFSGFEFVHLFTWTLSGGAKYSNAVSVIQGYARYFANSGSSVIDQIKYDQQRDEYKTSEYSSYKINGIIDEYVKGKLQGFFQFQYYGLIFSIFLLVIVLRHKPILSNRLMSLLCVFILLHFIIVLDLFRLNQHRYAYVLTVSHKYTVILVPMLSLVIAYQIKWIKENLAKITIPILISTILGGLTITRLAKLDEYKSIYSLLEMFVPVHNSQQYYLGVIDLIFKYTEIVLVVGLIILSFLYFKYKATFNKFWIHNQLSAVAILGYVFYCPFLIFFNTNFSLKKTLFNSFSTYEYRLENIKGWEDIYRMVNFINSLPEEKRILFANTSYKSIAIHLNIPSSKIELLTDTKNNIYSMRDILDFVNNNNINYLVTNFEQYPISKHNLVYSTSKLALYSFNNE